MATNTNNMGLFIPTTNVWDISQIYEIDINSPEFKELLVRLYQNINNIAVSTNLKDTGYYVNQEYICGQLYYPNPAYNSGTTTAALYRQVYRLIVPFGSLPNAGTKSVAHNLPVNTAYTWTRIYATATDPVGLTGIPIPYASPTLINNIELNVDATNVNIITGSNRTNYTICNVVLEYLKN